MHGTKPNIDINSSSEKPCERLIGKEKKEGEIVERSIIKEDSLMTPLTH